MHGLKLTYSELWREGKNFEKWVAAHDAEVERLLAIRAVNGSGEFAGCHEPEQILDVLKALAG